MTEPKRGPKAVTSKTADPKKTVRQTVDLSEDQYNQLARWRLQAALNLGVSRVTVQDALRETVEVLLADDEVGKAVTARLQKLYEED